MLKISIRITEVYFRLKMASQKPNQQEHKWCLGFYFRQNQGKYKLIKQDVEFEHQRQQINVAHDIYIQKGSLKQHIISYQILVHQKGSNKNKNSTKFIGKSQLALNPYLNSDKCPASISLILPVINNFDELAYIKMQILIQQMQEFAHFFKIMGQTSQQIHQNPIQDLQLSEQQINRDSSMKKVEQSKAILQKIKNRSQHYQQEIQNLTNENQDLRQQIRQRKEAVGLLSRIEQDKVNIVKGKNIKLQKEFFKYKQNISHLVNLINESGRLDIVQAITNLLAS